MLYIRPYSTTCLCFGYNQSIVIDFHKQESNFYSSKASKIVIKEYSAKTIDEIVESNRQYSRDIQEFVSHLIDNDLIFYTDNPDLFPTRIDYERSSSIVDNIQISFNKWQENKMQYIKEIINTYRIKVAKFDFRNCDENFIYIALEKFSNSTLASIECVFNHINYKINLEKLKRICTINQSVLKILVDNLPRELINLNYFNVYIHPLDESSPKIYPNYQLFKESIHVNNYFFKKLSIEEDETIRIAKSTETLSFLGDKLPTNILEKKILKEYQKFKKITKDNIDICKDCVFRYICVDNRLPHKRKENEWYHQQECNYNPYIAKWEGEEGYRTLAECGVISNEEGFSIDHERIAKINEELWGE